MRPVNSASPVSSPSSPTTQRDTFDFAGQPVRLVAMDHRAAGFGVTVYLEYVGMSLPIGYGKTLEEAMNSIPTRSQYDDLKERLARLASDAGGRGEEEREAMRAGWQEETAQIQRAFRGVAVFDNVDGTIFAPAPGDPEDGEPFDNLGDFVEWFMDDLRAAIPTQPADDCTTGEAQVYRRDCMAFVERVRARLSAASSPVEVPHAG